MGVQSFEDLPAASPSEVRDVYDRWRGWLCINGVFSVGQFKDPADGIVGVVMSDQGDLLADPVVVALHQPLYTQIFKGRLLESLRSRAPEALAVLGVGKVGFQVSYGSEYRKPANPDGEPGDLVRAACLIAIPKPEGTVLELQTRGYLLREAEGLASGKRWDTTVGGEKIVDDLGRPPLLSTIECKAMDDIAAVCLNLTTLPAQS